MEHCLNTGIVWKSWGRQMTLNHRRSYSKDKAALYGKDAFGKGASCISQAVSLRTIEQIDLDMC